MPKNQSHRHSGARAKRRASPESRAAKRTANGVLDSGPGADAPSRNDEKNLHHPHRGLAKVFQFHRVCGDARCKRAKACAGDDPPPCFERLWPHVPEASTILFRVYVTQSCAGASQADAMKAAVAAAALHEKQNAPPCTDTEAARKHVEASEKAVPQPKVRRL